MPPLAAATPRALAALAAAAAALALAPHRMPPDQREVGRRFCPFAGPPPRRDGPTRVPLAPDGGPCRAELS